MMRLTGQSQPVSTKNNSTQYIVGAMPVVCPVPQGTVDKRLIVVLPSQIDLSMSNATSDNKTVQAGMVRHC